MSGRLVSRRLKLLMLMCFGGVIGCGDENRQAVASLPPDLVDTGGGFASVLVG